MIVRALQEAEEVKLFGSSKSLVLVTAADAVGHVLIDTRLDAGTLNTLDNEHPVQCSSHAHYCIDGTGVGSINGRDYRIKPGTLIATASSNSITINAEADMRVVSIFCVGADVPTSAIVVRDLEEVFGTERDIPWGNGRSRRLLVRRDEMGFALCHTTGDPDTSSFIQYRNHFESCYYLSGAGEYSWETGSHPIITGEERATVFIMDKHDAHFMRITKESVCLSIFVPPIEGDECHDFSHGGASSY